MPISMPTLDLHHLRMKKKTQLQRARPQFHYILDSRVWFQAPAAADNLNIKWWPQPLLPLLSNHPAILTSKQHETYSSGAGTHQIQAWYTCNWNVRRSRCFASSSSELLHTSPWCLEQSIWQAPCSKGRNSYQVELQSRRYGKHKQLAVARHVYVLPHMRSSSEGSVCSPPSYHPHD